MAEPQIVTLKTPIKNLDDTVITELVIKEPKLKVLRKYGIPFDRHGTVDFDKAAGILESCTGIQLPILDTLSPADSMAAIGALANHFAGANDETVGN